MVCGLWSVPGVSKLQSAEQIRPLKAKSSACKVLLSKNISILKDYKNQNFVITIKLILKKILFTLLLNRYSMVVYSIISYYIF